jgi:hypothetical protein
MKKHTIWMILGCGLPLLLIFFAPALGLGYGTSLLIFILAMFACHLLMPMHHHSEHNPTDRQQNPLTKKVENHE